MSELVALPQRVEKLYYCRYKATLSNFGHYKDTIHIQHEGGKKALFTVDTLT